MLPNYLPTCEQHKTVSGNFKISLQGNITDRNLYRRGFRDEGLFLW